MKNKILIFLLFLAYYASGQTIQGTEKFRIIDGDTVWYPTLTNIFQKMEQPAGYSNINGDTLTGRAQKIIFDTNNGNYIARNNGTSTQIGMENGFNVMLTAATASSGASMPVDLSAGTVFAHTLTTGTATVANPTNSASGRFGVPYRVILKNASGGSSTVTFSSSWNKKDKTDVGNIVLAADDSLIYNFQLERNSGSWVMASMDDLGGSGGSVAGSNTQVQFNDGGALGADAGLVYNKTADYLQSGSGTEYVRLFKDSIQFLSSTIPTATSANHQWLRFTPTPAVASPYTYAPFGFGVETSPNPLAPYANMVWSLGPNAAGNTGVSIDATKPSFAINWETSWETGGVPIMEWHEHWKNPDSAAIRLKSYTIRYRNGYNPTATNPNIDLYHTADQFYVKSGSLWNSTPTFWSVARDRATRYGSMFLQTTNTNALTIAGVFSVDDYVNISATAGGTIKRLQFQNFRSYNYEDNLGVAMNSSGGASSRDMNWGTNAVNSSFNFYSGALNSGFRMNIIGDMTTNNPTQRGQVVISDVSTVKKLVLGARSDISLTYIASTENLGIKAPIVEIGGNSSGVAPAAGAAVIFNANAVNTTAVTRHVNTTVTGGIQTFITNATPQSAITANPGDLAFSNAGKWYGKVSGSATNTGWAEFLMQGANTLTQNTSFNGNFDWRLGNTTALDTVEIIGARVLLGTATNRWSIGSDFSRLFTTGSMVAYQVNNSTGVTSITVPDNTANALNITINGGNNILSATTTDGAEISNFGTASVGGRTNLASEVTNIAGSLGIVDRTITAAGTSPLANGDHYVYLNATTGAQTITLPTPTYKMVLEFKRIDNNPATVITFTGTVDGATNPTSTGGGSPIANLATQYGAIKLVWNGTNWYAF